MEEDITAVTCTLSPAPALTPAPSELPALSTAQLWLQSTPPSTSHCTPARSTARYHHIRYNAPAAESATFNAASRVIQWRTKVHACRTFHRGSLPQYVASASTVVSGPMPGIDSPSSPCLPAPPAQNRPCQACNSSRTDPLEQSSSVSAGSTAPLL